VRRQLFNLAAVVSLVLCVATGILWFATWPGASGIIRGQAWQEQQQGRIDCFLVEHGRLEWWSSLHDLSGSAVPSSTNYSWHREQYDHLPAPPTFVGFAFAQRGYIDGNTQWRFIAFPCWFVMLLLAILPAVRMRSWYVCRRRSVAGRCRTCGYDLCATPDRCPECGSETVAGQSTERVPP
jgi:hypothetical protein